MLQYIEGQENPNLSKLIVHKITSENELHIFLLLPQFVIMTAGEIMFSITSLQFSFTQVFWFQASTLKYRIKEHALLLIFNILPPLLAFFHPARLLIFRKISTLLVYSIPARLFHPACCFHPALLDYFFFIKKNIYTLLF